MQEQYFNSPLPKVAPREFWIRRIHSLTGLFLVLFLFEHLLTNSQAALFIGDDGAGFIRMVNFLKSLPYLPLIELFLLGFPILFHAWYGMVYLRQAKYNSGTLASTKGAEPALGDFSRNKAFTWQRITAIFLVVAILLHVIWMRFLNDPTVLREWNQTSYQVKVTMDEGLLTVADRLNVNIEQQADGLHAIADNPGTALLFVVRDTFKSPLLCILYSFFVLAASFHAMNGFWTFCISWGITLNEQARVIVRRCTNIGMALLAFLGLAAIWLTYWVNLRN
jgi:succinate dehydrogenase / fumarate reductase cytochrome b subunit